ncbi:MAG: hypothetical protein IPI35_32430 [Deltaproteobacteria bacterium]|nr:hypothetical protein [Deltaproteobacteria bacterium]
MRRLSRPALAEAPEGWLKARQAELDAERAAGASPDVNKRWDKHRRALEQSGVFSALQQMVGPHERCVWCVDSRAADVEHYRPKARFPEAVFVWENLLWACAPCNRKKGAQFPLAADGAPLLLDPTRQDPWDHLVFEPDTGQLVPRLDPATGEPDPVGAATCSPKLLPGRRGRSPRGRCVGGQRLLARPDAEQERRLFARVEAAERPELVVWALLREGRELFPFSAFCATYPTNVASLLAKLPQPPSPRYAPPA